MAICYKPNMAKIRLITLVVICGLAACTGGDDPPPTTSSTIATTVPLVTTPPPNLTESYFESLATAAVGGLGEASAALPGSAAAIYAEHQAASRGLLGLVAPRTLVVVGQGFEVCDPSDVCSTYAAVVTDPATGQVSSFSIDGVGLTGRIVGGGLIADRDGVVARVKSAYQTVDGDLTVLLEIDNTSDVTVELFGFAAVLEPGVGSDSVETTGAWGTGTIEQGVTADLLLRFPHADVGGQLRLSGLRSDGIDMALDVRVPTVSG